MNDRNQPVAIIGIALRAPGAETPRAFWANILAGRDTLTRPTEAQLRRSGVPAALIDNPRLVRAAPLLQDAGAFDPEFFGMSGREARMTDPAQRLFLTCAWEALESAGIIPGPEAGCVGVFGGSSSGPNSYCYRIFGGGAADLDDPANWLPVSLAGSPEHLTSRVCFKLDLQGPNMTVAAACATSLLAVHSALRSLAAGECELALAGGANVLVPDWPAYLFTEGGPVSPSGVLRPFDARADGTIFGSGAGVVVLKPLEQAIADGNHIYATILGTGICNDGGRKQSFTAPGAGGQTIAISRALEAAGVSADTIELVEAHGTATLAGDPVEVQSTTEAFRAHTDRTRYCAMGSVKGNIGHSGGSAGVLGLIKACLALAHRTLPPSSHFEIPNPELGLEDSPFFIPSEPQPWGTAGQRRAGVSAFGFGGNNVHAILEEAPPQPPRPQDTRGDEVIVLSARTETALNRQLEGLADHLETTPDLVLRDVSHTLQTGRREFEHRAAVVASSTRQAVEELRDRSSMPGVRAVVGRPVIFALPGQGSQRSGMGGELYEQDAGYRREIDRCAELLETHLGLDIRSLLHAIGDPGDDRLEATALAQPALFAVEYGLAKRLLASGVQPAAMIGHSVSELVAACLAGVFSLPDALALVARRGELMQACPPGSMLAVFLSAAEVEPFLGDNLEVAAVNAPDVTVVSGPTDAVTRLAELLQSEGIDSRSLHTSHAFHSRSMEPAISAFREAVAAVPRSEPTLPFVSGLTGRLISAAEAMDPEYWARHLREPVQFSKGVGALNDLEGALWIEVGPGRALSTLLNRQLPGAVVVAALEEHPSSLPGLLGRLWTEGVEVDWRRADNGAGPRTVPLPTYPFESKRYWIDPPVYHENGDREPAPASMDSDEEPQWLHAESWQKGAHRTPEPASGDGWLVFEDARGLGAALRSRLEQAGARVVSLLPGSAFKHLGDGRFQVLPGDTGHLLRALRQAAESGWTAHRVLHLWELTGEADSLDSAADLDRTLKTGVETLVSLVQALFEAGMDEAVDLSVAADRVLLPGDEKGVLSPPKASLVGPCRVIPLEMKTFSAQLIDVPAVAVADGWLAEALLAEAARPQPGTLKALRPEGRWVQHFAPLTGLTGSGGIRPGGVVLITGGAGGLGLECARRLFEMAGMRLALLTRWRPPADGDWSTVAQQNDRVGRALAKAAALREQGAEVLFVQGDAADRASMERALETVRSHFGAIHGVIHASGVGRAALAVDTDRADVPAVFASKARAALILQQLLGGTPLDFFVSFSSIASVAPTDGQLDYGAANAVLDAQARSSGPDCWQRKCAISWDAWDEVGMAVDYARDRPGFKRAFISSIPLQTGLDILQEILTADDVPAHVVVTARAFEPPGGETAPAGRQESPSPLRDPGYRAPSDPVQETIARIWEEILAVDPVGVDDDFIELGGDSIASIQVLSRLRRELGVGLPQNAVLESGTVARLASLIADSRPGVDC